MLVDNYKTKRYFIEKKIKVFLKRWTWKQVLDVNLNKQADQNLQESINGKK